MQRYDIFCKIVDNYGDIGVCWRLAKQLANEHGLQVRLLVDDFTVASKIIHTIDINKQSQFIDNFEILHFNNASITPAEVVLETFACGLPAAYLQQMGQAKSCWINLDYLSAEAWVSDFHGKPSPHPTLPITRHFFFPGFTQNTGGLIREAEATAYIRHAYIAHISADNNSSSPNDSLDDFPFCKRGIEGDLTQRQLAPKPPQPPFEKGGNHVDSTNALNISLFAYPNAPIADLLFSLQNHQHAVHLYVPTSSILPKVAQFFGEENLAEYAIISRGNLTCTILPFLSQADYDTLLRSCDLNFVRGEDSWIRAIWAGKPFIWQPYYQTENTHLVKLEAFINLYYKTCEQKKMVWEAHRTWLAGQAFGSVCQNYLNSLSKTAVFCQQQSMLLATQTDLASRLLGFCNQL